MRRHDEPVSAFMRTEFVTCEPSDRLDFADDVMKLGQIRHMPVVENNRVVGIVSQRDLLAASLSRALDIEPEHHRSFLRSVEIAEVMSNGVITVAPTSSIGEAASLMIRHKIGCLPVVDSVGRPVGLITETDLLRAVYGSAGSSESE
jgi:CBS domain-containing protein